MDMIPIKPERKSQLEQYAQRRGQDSASALDDALANYFEWAGRIPRKQSRVFARAIRM